MAGLAGVLFAVVFFIFTGNLSGQDKIKISRVKGTIYKIFLNDFVNIYALTGSEGVLLVDSGPNDTAEYVKKELTKLGNGDIKYIVNTHSDWDHIAGNQDLGKNAVVISQKNTREQIKKYINWKDFPFDREVLRNSLQSLTFRNKMTLFFNGEIIEFISLPGAHTGDDIIVYFRNAKVACMGDMFLPGSFPVVKLYTGASIKGLINNINKVINMFPDDVKFVFGHGRDYSAADLRIYCNMLNKTIQTVSERIKAGKSLKELKKGDCLSEWKSWSGKVFEEVNSDMWIETIYKSISQKNN